MVTDDDGGDRESAGSDGAGLSCNEAEIGTMGGDGVRHCDAGRWSRPSTTRLQ